MMKYNICLRTFSVTAMAILTACGAMGQKSNLVNPLSVPPVEVDEAGYFTVADCPTQHPVLDVRLHEGEFSIDTVEIYSDGMLMQRIPIREEDAITRKVVHFLDANFDGNVDILIGPGCNREYSALILWDRERECYARATNDGFSVFNGEFYYDQEHQVVYRMTSSSAFETTYTMMVWMGTDLQSEENFLMVFDPSYYDSYRVSHRYTVRNYYSDEDAISTDDPTAISSPWDHWLVSPFEE